MNECLLSRCPAKIEKKVPASQKNAAEISCNHIYWSAETYNH